ncbi:hypothetical protein UO65_0850 [Actinokineospora spheciospongiae]|uniref:Uncharacterized protein n=1 Tax=Actinokineospora spheciospongiae TaxID=909613 RepID=W7J4A8_9PSEU|nr:hypothetical protein UO65_0850 [Actinokineospora spheciospongiae]
MELGVGVRRAPEFRFRERGVAWIFGGITVTSLEGTGAVVATSLSQRIAYSWCP